jgi:hypothetical protein
VRPKQDIYTLVECVSVEGVGTKADRTNDNTPVRGSIKDTITDADKGATGGILSTQCATRMCAHPGGQCVQSGRNSYVNAARRAL